MTEMHKDSQDLHIVLVDHLPKTRKELKKLKNRGLKIYLQKCVR